jgi:hypothetical protein
MLSFNRAAVGLQILRNNKKATVLSSVTYKSLDNYLLALASKHLQSGKMFKVVICWSIVV